PQALAAAKPVIAYDCDGAREVCLAETTGFLVRPGEVSDLAAPIIQLARDPCLRARFGPAGQDFVKKHFPPDKMADAIYQLYLALKCARLLISIFWHFSCPRVPRS